MDGRAYSLQRVVQIALSRVSACLRTEHSLEVSHTAQAQQQLKALKEGLLESIRLLRDSLGVEARQFFDANDELVQALGSEQRKENQIRANAVYTEKAFKTRLMEIQNAILASNLERCCMLSREIHGDLVILSILRPGSQAVAFARRGIAMLVLVAKTFEELELRDIDVTYLQNMRERINLLEKLADDISAEDTENSCTDVDVLVEAVSNPKWDFRTVESLSEETKLSSAKVQNLLEHYPMVFRKSPVTSKEGRVLYALKEKPIRWRERLALLHRSLRWDR